MNAPMPSTMQTIATASMPPSRRKTWSTTIGGAPPLLLGTSDPCASPALMSSTTPSVGVGASVVAANVATGAAAKGDAAASAKGASGGGANGARVVGSFVVGNCVVGGCVVGNCASGNCVVGNCVVGACVVGGAFDAQYAGRLSAHTAAVAFLAQKKLAAR